MKLMFMSANDKQSISPRRKKRTRCQSLVLVTINMELISCANGVSQVKTVMFIGHLGKSRMR